MYTTRKGPSSSEALTLIPEINSTYAPWRLGQFSKDSTQTQGRENGSTEHEKERTSRRVGRQVKKWLVALRPLWYFCSWMKSKGLFFLKAPQKWNWCIAYDSLCLSIGTVYLYMGMKTRKSLGREIYGIHFSRLKTLKKQVSKSRLKTYKVSPGQLNKYPGQINQVIQVSSLVGLLPVNTLPTFFAGISGDNVPSSAVVTLIATCRCVPMKPSKGHTYPSF